MPIHPPTHTHTNTQTHKRMPKYTYIHVHRPPTQSYTIHPSKLKYHAELRGQPEQAYIMQPSVTNKLWTGTQPWYQMFLGDTGKSVVYYVPRPCRYTHGNILTPLHLFCNRQVLRWPIKDINFILVLNVFLSLSTAEEMFSPRNYTFHRGKKSFLRGENFIPRNYAFLRRIILFSAELNFHVRKVMWSRASIWMRAT